MSAGKVAEARASYERIIAEARPAGLVRTHADGHAGLALCCERQGDTDAAIGLYERAEEIMSSLPPTAAVAAVAGKARCLIMSGDLRFAIHVLEQRLLDLEREGLEDPDALTRLHVTLVGAYHEAGLYNKAFESASEALRLSTKVTDQEVAAAMNLNVARALLQRGDIEGAERCLMRAQDLYGRLELQDQLAKARYARGYVLSRQGLMVEAEEEFSIAFEMLREVDSPLEAARVGTELARVRRMQEDEASAITWLERAIELIGDKDPAELGQANRELAECFSQQGDTTSAEKHARRAIELFERSEETRELAAAYRVLGDILRDRGEQEAGNDAYRAGILLIERSL